MAIDRSFTWLPGSADNGRMTLNNLARTKYGIRTFVLVVSVAMAGALAACSDDNDDDGGMVDVIDPPGDPILASIGAGSFQPLDGYDSIYGRAHVARMLDGKTTFELHVEGLSPGVAYGVHIHALPCEENAGGGHYKIDPAVAETVEENEIWPTFTTDDGGIGRRTLTVDHAARMDAQSIVIHDTENNNTKMACANLQVPYDGDWTRSGTLAPFAGAEAIDNNIAGTAEFVVNSQGSTLTMSIQGLDAQEMYTSHIHVYPCEVDDAGGHYKIDTTVETAEETNELWPIIDPDGDGNAEVTFNAAHVTRADAQSVVIHRQANGSAPKVACANLARAEFIEHVIVGTTNVLTAGMDRGYSDATTVASITRRLDGSTAFELLVDGLDANQDYGVHVHDYSCNTADGGGHYKIDDSVADTVEDNEVWLSFTTDSDGGAERKVLVQHLARPEAQSVIVHDYSDAERVICIDFDER